MGGGTGDLLLPLLEPGLGEEEKTAGRKGANWAQQGALVRWAQHPKVLKKAFASRSRPFA